MPTWFVLILISILVLAAAEIAQKVALTRKDDISAEANNFMVWMIQGTLALIYFFFLVKTPVPQISLPEFLKLIVLGSVYFWAGTLYYTSYKTGSASVNSILASSSIIVSTTLGIIFFHESSSIIKLLGSLIIILAIIYINYEKKMKWSKGNNFALVGAALYGLGFTLDKSFSLQLSPHLYQIFFAYMIGLTGLVYRGKVIIKDLARVEINTFKVVCVSAITFFIWNKLTFVAYTVGGEVGRIDSINNSVIFVIILLEFFLLKDKSNLKKKIIAAFIAMLGVTILAFAK